VLPLAHDHVRAVEANRLERRAQRPITRELGPRSALTGQSKEDDQQQARQPGLRDSYARTSPRQAE